MQERWSSLHRSGRPRPELLMRLGLRDPVNLRKRPPPGPATLAGLDELRAPGVIGRQGSSARCLR